MTRSRKYLINSGMLTILLAFFAFHVDSLNSLASQTDAVRLNNLIPGSGSIKKSIMSYQEEAPVASYTQEASISSQQAANCQSQASHAKASGATEAAGQDLYYNCLRNALATPSN